MGEQQVTTAAGDARRRDADAGDFGARSAAVAVPRRGGLAPSVLRDVCAAIEERLDERIALAELARRARLSPWHFSRAFKESTGVAPCRYIAGRRVALAAEALRNSDRSIAAIALEAGFADHSHFTRCFVRVTGETPRAFRHRSR